MTDSQDIIRHSESIPPATVADAERQRLGEMAIGPAVDDVLRTRYVSPEYPDTDPESILGVEPLSELESRILLIGKEGDDPSFEHPELARIRLLSPTRLGFEQAKVVHEACERSLSFKALIHQSSASDAEGDNEYDRAQRYAAQDLAIRAMALDEDFARYKGRANLRPKDPRGMQRFYEAIASEFRQHSFYKGICESIREATHDYQIISEHLLSNFLSTEEGKELQTKAEKGDAEAVEELETIRKNISDHLEAAKKIVPLKGRAEELSELYMVAVDSLSEITLQEDKETANNAKNAALALAKATKKTAETNAKTKRDNEVARIDAEHKAARDEIQVKYDTACAEANTTAEGIMTDANDRVAEEVAVFSRQYPGVLVWEKTHAGQDFAQANRYDPSDPRQRQRFLTKAAGSIGYHIWAPDNLDKTQPMPEPQEQPSRHDRHDTNTGVIKSTIIRLVGGESASVPETSPTAADCEEYLFLERYLNGLDTDDKKINAAKLVIRKKLAVDFVDKVVGVGRNRKKLSQELVIDQLKQPEYAVHALLGESPDRDQEFMNEVIKYHSGLEVYRANQTKLVYSQRVQKALSEELLDLPEVKAYLRMYGIDVKYILAAKKD
jgi:hypothetical protein